MGGRAAVAAFFFGGYFLPAQVGPYTQAGAAFYALLLLASAGTLAWNYLRRADVKTEGARKDKTNSTRMKKN